jgi:hypothetical protein
MQQQDTVERSHVCDPDEPRRCYQNTRIHSCIPACWSCIEHLQHLQNIFFDLLWSVVSADIAVSPWKQHLKQQPHFFRADKYTKHW